MPNEEMKKDPEYQFEQAVEQKGKDLYTKVTKKEEPKENKQISNPFLRGFLLGREDPVP